MLTRHARLSPSPLTRSFSSSLSIAADSLATRSKPSWLETKGRTRSLLFDEDNPVTNKEAHKLHKIHLVEWNVKDKPELAQVLERRDVQVWQTNPYLSMLASPIRKCMWSDKVMPRDFLIPIKAALFASEADKTEGRKLSSLDKDASISIFPRALLHPAFVATDESKGKKDSRGYVVCKKSAVHDFANKGSWKRLDKLAIPNPYLVYQVESQLRERIVQELKLLKELARERVDAASTADKESKSSTSNPGTAVFVHLPQKTVSNIQGTRSLRQDVLQESSEGITTLEGTCDPPAALFDFTDPTSKDSLVPEGQFSTLLPYKPSVLKGYELHHLPQHRVPIYSMPRLFELDFERFKQASLEDENCQPATSGKKASRTVKKEGESPLWSDLVHKAGSTSAHDQRDMQIYMSEVKACQRRRKEFEELAASMLAMGTRNQSLDGTTVAVPSMSASVLPLLKALWRYRMWLGEGWSGDGFGVLEATGRRKAA